MSPDESVEHLAVALPAGDVEIPVTLGRPEGAWAAVAIAHGAGAGSEHPFYVGLVAALWSAGVAVVRFDFPYRAAGRRLPGPAAHAITTWETVEELIASRWPELVFFAAGKSYGGRMASMAAAEGVIRPAALIYLGYPLHPPGNPMKLRTAHLPAITAPQLFVAGTRDAFVLPHEQLEEAVASCSHARIEWVDGADHSFEVAGRKRPAEEVGAALVPVVTRFLESVRSGQRPAA